jgi:hypothetical protein
MANDTLTARAMTVDEILARVAPLYFQPTPTRRRLKTWLDRAGCQRFKANIRCTHGGGQVFYAMCDVERVFRSRVFPRKARQ